MKTYFYEMSYSKSNEIPPPYMAQDTGYYIDERRAQPKNQDDPLDQFPVVLKWIIKIGIVILAAVTMLCGIIGFFLSILDPICFVSNIIIL